MRDCRIHKKRKRGKRKLLVALFILAVIIAAVCIFIKLNVNPILLELSNAKIRALTTDAVSSAVLDVMSEETDTEFLTVVRDEKNNIKSVDMNSAAITAVAQKITIEAQKRIDKIGSDGIRIPIGSLSGVTLFTGLGPDIKIRIYLVGSTKTQIISVFSDAGINQTLHRLYLNVSGSVAVAVPGLPSTIKTSTQALMSEMIIVGDVPPTYLNATNIGDMLDLVAS